MEKKEGCYGLMKRFALTETFWGCVLCMVMACAACDNRNIHQVVKEMAGAEVDTVGWPARTLCTNPFFSVDVDCFADVTYHQTMMGDDHYVEVKAPRNVLDNIDVVVEDGVLKVCVDRRYRMPEKAVAVVNVYAPFVNRFILMGGKCLRLGKVALTSPLELMVDGKIGTMMADSISAHEVSMMLDGSGSFDLKGLQTGTVRTKLKGNGAIYLAGQCDSVKILLQGDGKIDISALERVSINKEKIIGDGKILK